MDSFWFKLKNYIISSSNFNNPTKDIASSSYYSTGSSSSSSSSDDDDDRYNNNNNRNIIRDQFSYFKLGYSCATNTLFDPNPNISHDIRQIRFAWLKFFKEQSNMMIVDLTLYVRPVTSDTLATVDYTLVHHGIFHTILILTTNHPNSYYRYFYCDRVVEEIRFEPLTEMVEKEQLLNKPSFKVISISNYYEDLDNPDQGIISSKAFAQFIEQESIHGYSLLSNNCIHFSYHAYCLFVSKHKLSQDTMYNGWSLREYWSCCHEKLYEQHWDDRHYPLFRDRRTGQMLIPNYPDRPPEDAPSLDSSMVGRINFTTTTTATTITTPTIPTTTTSTTITDTIQTAGSNEYLEDQNPYHIKKQIFQAKI